MGSLNNENKDEIRIFPNTIHKIQDLNGKVETMTFLRKIYTGHTLTFITGNPDLRIMKHQSKVKKQDLIYLKHLHRRGNPKQKKKTADRMRKYVCNQTYPQGIHVQNIERVCAAQCQKNKTSNSSNKRAHDRKKYVSKEGRESPMRHITRCSSSLLETGPSEVPVFC